MCRDLTIGLPWWDAEELFDLYACLSVLTQSENDVCDWLHAKVAKTTDRSDFRNALECWWDFSKHGLSRSGRKYIEKRSVLLQERANPTILREVEQINSCLTDLIRGLAATVADGWC